MARNWNDMGVEWATETVKLDGREYAGAEIVMIADLDKFAKALRADGGDVMEVLNASNSPRVASQDVKRRHLDKSGETLRDMVWNRLVGTRAPRSARPATVYVVNLPNGDRYTGTSKVEFMQAFIAAMVDLGITVDVAKLAAEKAANATEHLN